MKNLITGRIVRGVGGLYTVDTIEGIYSCKPRGLFRKDSMSPLVGDVVEIDVLDGETGLIVNICERLSLLNRPRVANVNQVLLVVSLKRPNINYDLLDRFLINCEAVKVDVVLCINKADLVNGKDMTALCSLKSVYEQAGYPVILISAETKQGFLELKALLQGKISVFAGPSGVGKSSISNVLAPHKEMETGELSRKIQRGRHTTRHSELIKIGADSYIIDSPGFSSVFFENIQRDDLYTYFREFKPYIGQCRFGDCRHIGEPDCAVKAALSGGLISSERYKRYLSYYSEFDG